MDNCCQSLVKYLIFIFNFLFAFTGLALIGLGAYCAYVHTQVQSNSNLQSVFIFFIIIGIVIFVISFFGCCGSLLENKCMLYTYAAFLVIILLAEVFVAISVYKLMADMDGVMREEITNYGKPDHELITLYWDFLQQNQTCCGVIDYNDWEANLPSSCCDMELPTCNIDNVYPEGCLGRVETMLFEVATAAIGIALLQMMMIICACWIGRLGGKGEDINYLMIRI